MTATFTWMFLETDVISHHRVSEDVLKSFKLLRFAMISKSAVKREYSISQLSNVLTKLSELCFSTYFRALLLLHFNNSLICVYFNFSYEMEVVIVFDLKKKMIVTYIQ